MSRMSKRVCVVGDGGWGTALALHLRSLGNSVTVWGHDATTLAGIRAKHINSNFLPGISLPEDISWTPDPVEAAAGAEVVVLAAPSKYLGAVCGQFRRAVPAGADVVSVAKGLCPKTFRRMSEVAAEALGIPEVAALSGPSHAEEVARGIPTAVVVAARDAALAERLQRIFSGGCLRVYTSADPIGVEIGGALKNIIAVAVGASDGLGFGDNTRAALITRGLAEMSRLGAALGADPATFAGLSGMGDLVVTCTSRHSRNHSVGERLGKGETLAEIRSSMVQVAEGVVNCPIAVSLARSLGVELPIAELVQKTLDGEMSPLEAVGLLMGRALRAEHRTTRV